MYRQQVGWDTISPQFYKRLDTGSTSHDQFKAFMWLFKQMNDFHSQVYFNGRIYNYYLSMPEGREDELTRTYRSIQPRMNLLEAKVLDNEYGYIAVPGTGSLNDSTINTLARQWRDSICKNINNPVKGWIIDLRANMGGNMYPMMAALSFLIGDSRFAGMTGDDHKPAYWWSIKKGNILFRNSPQTFLPPHCLKSQIKAPVVVLTSFYTVSSGEVVVTAFKGRPATVQIGDTTGGLVTGNQWIPIGNDAVLNLSQGYYADRNGKEYRSGIPPDIPVKAEENFAFPANDKKIQAAIAWLRKQK